MLSSLLSVFYRIDWDSEDDTWTPDQDTELVSSWEEEYSGDNDEDEDADADDDDPDYRPKICVKYVFQIIFIHFNRSLGS